MAAAPKAQNVRILGISGSEIVGSLESAAAVESEYGRMLSRRWGLMAGST